MTSRRSSINITHDGIPRERHSSIGAGPAPILGMGLDLRGHNEYVEGHLKPLDVVECQREVMCVRFSPDGLYYAVGLANGVVSIYNSASSQLLYNLTDDSIKADHLPAVAIRFPIPPEEGSTKLRHIIMVAYASGVIKFWHYTSSSCLQTVRDGRKTLTCAFNPDASHFTTAGTDMDIIVYDMETKKRISNFHASDSRDKMNGHRSRVFALQYHPLYPTLFVSGGWDDTVQFWDERQHHRHSVRSFYGPHICGDGLDIDPQHNHILTGSWRKHNVLQIWDFGTGEKIKDVPQDTLHASQLYCCQWLGKDMMVCGGNDLNQMRVIDRGTLNTIGQFINLEKGVICIDNDRISQRPKIAIGTGNKCYTLRTEKRMI